MSTIKDPTPYLPWLVSRASGIIALGLVTLAVLLGLTMSTKLLRRPAARRTVVHLHEHVALVAMGAIGLHGVSLLGDRWLHPGLGGLTVPFAMSYSPLATGLGIIAGYLAVLLGLSFYARRRIGARLWRRLHTATALVWLLGVAHTLGAGSDAETLWLRAFVLAPTIPITYLLVRRMLPASQRAATEHERRRGGVRAGAEAPSPVLRARTLAEEPSS
jgi:sulfoxide reductase heme-binding subunit YedZ